MEKPKIGDIRTIIEPQGSMYICVKHQVYESNPHGRFTICSWKTIEGGADFVDLDSCDREALKKFPDSSGVVVYENGKMCSFDEAELSRKHERHSL